MNAADVAGLIRDGMIVVLKVGGPMMLAGLAVGLMVSLLQAITQINEATLAYVPKVLALGVTALLTGGFMFSTLSGYMRLLFDRMVNSGLQ
ncbi:MAG: flagellar biosynthetic protein FliQ [Acetobacteraceae bacterium]